jgi:adenosine deaminase
MRLTPVVYLLKRGLLVTVNSDGRTLSATSCTREFQDLFAHKGWTLDEFWRCQHNAVAAAFVSADTRQFLEASLLRAAKESVYGHPKGNSGGS